MRRIVRLTVLVGTATSLGCSEPSGDVLSPSPPPPTTIGEFAAAIAFVSDRDGVPSIYLASEDGASVGRLVAGAAPAWSWDGTRIAYTRPDPTGAQAIHVIDADGSNERRVVSGRDPAWMPGDAELVYAAEGGIFAIGLAEPAQPRKLIDDDLVLPRPDWWDADQYDAGWVEAPTFSPDGSKIAFLRVDPLNWDYGATRNTYVLAAGGSEARLLGGTCVISPPGSGIVACPVETVGWSPGGSSLSALTYQFLAGTRWPVIVTLGSPDWVLTQIHHFSHWMHGPPSWSSDGTRISFTYDQLVSDDKGTRIFFINVETSSVGQLIPDAATPWGNYRDWGAVWLPAPPADPCNGCWDY